jgi:hypothetical protein
MGAYHQRNYQRSDEGVSALQEGVRVSAKEAGAVLPLPLLRA